MKKTLQRFAEIVPNAPVEWHIGAKVGDGVSVLCVSVAALVINTKVAGSISNTVIGNSYVNT